MPRWLPKVLTRIRELAASRQVSFTLKAQRGLARLDLALDEEDACDVLANLAAEDWVGRQVSGVTGEWMYVFKPHLAEIVVYIKLILRSDCVIISFHEDEGADHEQEEDKEDGEE